MARQRTIDELIADAREYADAVDDYGYWSATRMARLANESGKRLHSKLTQILGADYSVEQADLSTTAGTPSVNLDSGGTLSVEKIVSLDWIHGGQTHPIKLGNRSMRVWRDRAWAPGKVFYIPENFASQSQVPRLRLFPTPPAVYQLEVEYIPGWADISGSSNITLNEDWFRFVALDMAIQMKIKEGTDARMLMAERADILVDIEASAPSLDEEQSHVVRAVDTTIGGLYEYPTDEADW
jgi:hypothetical protein